MLLCPAHAPYPLPPTPISLICLAFPGPCQRRAVQPWNVQRVYLVQNLHGRRFTAYNSLRLLRGKGRVLFESKTESTLLSVQVGWLPICVCSETLISDWPRYISNRGWGGSL